MGLISKIDVVIIPIAIMSTKPSMITSIAFIFLTSVDIKYANI